MTKTYRSNALLKVFRTYNRDYARDPLRFHVSDGEGLLQHACGSEETPTDLGEAFDTVIQNAIDKQKDDCVRRIMEGESVVDIAEDIGISTSAVFQRIFRQGGRLDALREQIALGLLQDAVALSSAVDGDHWDGIIAALTYRDGKVCGALTGRNYFKVAVGVWDEIVDGMTLDEALLKARTL